MKKLFLFLIITCLSFGCNNKVGGVDDNADGQDLSPTMRAAFNVLKSAGDMPKVPDTRGGLAIITRCDTSQTVIHDYSGFRTRLNPEPELEFTQNFGHCLLGKDSDTSLLTKNLN